MRTLIAVTLAALALAAPAAAATTTKVTVVATEFHFKLSKPSVKAGKVTFVLLNKGHVGHDFAIAGKHTPVIDPGKSATLTVTLKKGSYKYECTVPGHAAAGMKGMLIVK
jgi:uncharacterized cupredoxin-like copper-binding protein